MNKTVLTKQSLILEFLSKKSNEPTRLLAICVRFFILLILVFQSLKGFSQQDCAGAIPVCQQTYVQTNSYSGFGTQEVFNTCLTTQERASVWYIFTVQVGGSFGFNLNTSNDYDWALYNISNSSCANIPNMTPVRCNYSGTYGNTGMNAANIGGAVEATGAGGSPISNGLDVTVGQTYALIIDNYTMDLNGYTLTFTGTSNFLDVTAPTFSSNTNNCYGNYVTITLSENVTCNSIAANGSDFQISGPGSPTITSAVGVGCPGNGTTNQVQVYYNASSSGQFTITSKVGNDGNTILDRCGNALAVGQTATFNHLGTVTASASPSAICAGATVNLSVTGPASGGTYAWSNGATTSSTTVTPTSTTTYTVTVSYGGCTKTTSTTVTLASNPVVSISPINPIVCTGGTVDLTATSLVNGVSCSNCSYNWNTSTYVQNNVPSSVWTGRGIGNYTVTVTTAAGCTGTASTTVAGPSANPASCNVIFASPNGAGNGLSAGSPTTLANAITMAACNNAIIKLQIGTYIIDNPLSIASAMTIEGGYNVGYTSKSSLAGATTITRSALNVEGLPDAGRLVALQALNQSNFRLQDITITTAAAPVATPTYPKGVSTYGIYLTSCSNYNIVRCQILPGAAGAGYGDDNPATYNSTWDGANGTNGGNGITGNAGGCDWGYDSGASGRDGGNGGVGGSNASVIGGSGGNGGGGGKGGNGRADDDSNNGYPGLAGFNNSANNATPGTGGAGGPQDSNNNDTPYGGFGGSGNVGPPGVAGSILGINNYTGGYYNPSYGTNGTAGQGGSGGGGGGGAGRDTDGINAAGGGGSGGGGGGGGGGAGRGAFGGGSSFGLFINNGGANGNLIDCFVNGGTFGQGGLGGKGGNGGNGGTSQLGNGCGDGDANRGGRGGNGGNGGKGGDGGNGGDGVSMSIYYYGGGQNLASSSTNFNLASQPTITASNIGCTQTTITHTGGAAANFTNFGSGSSPASNSLTTQYSTTGRKTIVMSGNTYTDFTNILIAASIVTPSIITASTTICPGTANFTASTFGQGGLSYSWTVTNPSGGSSTIAAATNGTTNITFTNTGTTSLTYTVNLTITSSCCGSLPPVSLQITVPANPILTNPTSTNVCVGGNTSFSSTVTGTASNGQWQMSADNGGSWNAVNPSSVYSNVTASPLSLTGVTAGMNGFLYRYSVVGPCGTVTSNPATLTINTPPTASVSASPTNVCSVTNQSSTLTFTFTGSAPWTVTYNTVTANGTTPSTFTTSNNPHTISVTPTADVSYNITSVYTVAGCANTTLAGTAINVTTAVPNVVVSSTNVVQCGNVNLTTLVLPPPTSTLDGPLTYSAGNPTSVGTGSYTITNSNACGTDSETVTVTVNTAPTITLTPSSTICSGTSVTLSTTVSTGGGTYLWSPGGQTTSSITVTPGSTTTYGVTYTPPGCSPISASSTITVRPTPSAFISGTTTVCQNAAQPPITFTNPNADKVIVSYTRTLNGGSATNFTVEVNGNGGTATDPVPTGSVGTYVYTITSVQFQSGTPNCNIVQSGSATVTITPSPTVSISGGQTVCQNGASPFVTFTNNNTSDVLASYTVNGVAATPILVPANGTATVGVNTSTSGTITYALTGVAFNTPGGCTATASGSAIFNIVALPTVTISGTASVCQGGSSPNISISNNNSVAVTVTYNLTGNPNQTMVINAGATGTIPVSTASTGVFTYNLVGVAMNGSSGCSATASGSATITVVQTPSVSISGGTTVCQGDAAPTVTFTNFSTSPVSISYSISPNPSTTISVPANGGTNTVTHPTGTSGTFVYNLESASFTSGNACPSTVSGTITVNVLPLPTATLFGTETVCENGNATGFTITNPRPYDEQVTYTFTGGSPTTVLVPADGTYIIYPTTTPSGTFTYTLTSVAYSNYSTCSSTLTGQTATLTVLPAPTATISGSTSLCLNGAGSTITFTNPSLTSSVVVSYNLNGGATQTINVSANTTATIPFTPSAVGTYTYNLEAVAYTGSNACTSPLTGSATIVVNALPTGTISGTATVCQGSVTNLTFTNNSNAEVVMTYALGGVNSTVIVPANGTNTVAASTGTTGTLTYNLVSIAYTSGSPCTQSASGQAIVTVNPAPTATLTTSVTSACQNTNSPTVTINNPTGQAITVVYTISDGTNTTTLTENITGNSAGLPVPTTTAATYTYSITSVAYQSGGGCTNTGVTSVVTMQITAPPTITNTAVTVCSGTALNIPLTSNPSGATFEWSALNNINVTGQTVSPIQTTNTITDVLVATTSVPVTYTIIPTLNGCAGDPSTLIVTVSPPPAAPTTGTVTQPTCAVPTGTVALSGLPATGTWTVTATPGSVTATGTGTTGTISGLAPGTYTFTVANASGCASGSSTSVTVDAAPSSLSTPTISGANVCLNDDAVFTIAGLPIGTSISYNLNSGATQNVTTTANPFTITVNTATTNQTLTITSIVSGACSATVPTPYPIIVDPACEPFSQCTPLVYRVNGSGSSLNGNAFEVSVGEINPATGAIDTTYTTQFQGANLLTSIGNSPVTGFMNSYNGFLAVPGLNVADGTTNLNNNPFNGNNKVINIINQSTSVVNRVTFNNIFNGSNITSAIPTSQTTFYVSGNGTNNGIYYYDGTNFNPIITGVGVRNLEIFNGDLYFSQGSTTAGIYKFNGLPQDNSVTPTALFTLNNFDPYGFSVSPDGCSMYVAIGTGNSSHNSIAKFIKNPTTGVWSFPANYRYSTERGTGLVVDYYSDPSGRPIIYAAIGNSGLGLKLVKLLDTGTALTTTGAGWTPNPVSAPANTRYAGIDFAPNLNPLITTQPTNLTACSTANASISVGASSNAGTLSYQWYQVTSATQICNPQPVGTNSPNFTPPVGTGYYYVRVIVDNGTCKQYMNSRIVTTTITAPPTATLTSANFCSTSNTPTSLVLATTGDQTGYTWSADAGLVGFNTANGIFTPNASAQGTYTVTYTIPTGVCPQVVATGQVNIIASPSASISYTGSPFCTSSGNQTVNLSGDAGGTYTATPAGLTISSLSGTITPGSSTAGTYDITYTIPAAGGCSAVTSTVQITITAAPTATISYSGPFCANNATAQAVNFSGTTGGTFTASPSGLTIDATTGAITPNTSTGGAYTVTYTLPAANGCPIFTTTASITISALPNVTASLSSTSSCNGGTLTLTGGQAGMTSYSWTGPAGATFSPNAFTQSPTVTMGSTAGTFTLSVTDGAGCSNSATTAVVTINPSPTVTMNCNNFCVGTNTTVSAAPSPAGTYTYVWTVPPGLSPNPGSVDSFSTNVTGTYSVVVTNTATTCPSAIQSCTINTFTLPSIIFLSPP